MMKGQPYHWLWLSDAVGVNYEKAFQRTEIDTIIIPENLLKDGFSSGLVIDKIPDAVNKLMREKPVLRYVVDNFLKMQSEQGSQQNKNFAKMLVYVQYRFFESVLHCARPKKVFIWCKFMNLHQILAQVCYDCGIRPIFIEFGLLPGTLNIECGGQMGESYAARKAKSFASLPVSRQELDNTASILQTLREHPFNRNLQPDDELMLKEHPLYIPGRPLIVYCGQNDYESGLYPYTDVTHQYHSPYWKTSEDPLKELSRLARKHRWNLVYKPHPSKVRIEQGVPKLPENVILIEKCNLHALIDQADLVVTILSQVGYEALIRKRPVMMLGYNQLRGKKCTYECYHENDLEKELLQALKKGLTDAMYQKFVIHISQALNTFLFDDMNEEHGRYGLSCDTLFGYVKKGFPYKMNQVQYRLDFSFVNKVGYWLPEIKQRARRLIASLHE